MPSELKLRFPLKTMGCLFHMIFMTITVPCPAWMSWAHQYQAARYGDIKQGLNVI